MKSKNRKRKIFIQSFVPDSLAPPLYAQSQNSKYNGAFSGYIYSYLLIAKRIRAQSIWEVPVLVPFKVDSPLYKSKKNTSDYRVHGTQNDRLELTVSTQKSVLKNMHWVQRYHQKRPKI